MNPKRKTKITPAADKYLIRHLGRKYLANMIICADKITLPTARQFVRWYRQEFS